jgi:hypothetical protein
MLIRDFLLFNISIFSSTIQTDPGNNLTDSTTTLHSKLVRQVSQVIVGRNLGR